MEVQIHHIAGKYPDRLPEPALSRIKSALAGLGEEPPDGDIRPLAGQEGYFRLKIGGYRVLFRYRDNTVFVTHIDPRGQSYNKKNKGKKR
jgi:mRNA interferase RelE/StbE